MEVVDLGRSLVCNEISGMADCEFMVKANDDNEVLVHAWDHASRIHNMQKTPELEEKLKLAIHST